MRLGSDRLVCLAGILASRKLGYSILKTGEARHLVARTGKEAPRLILVAHYDRASGSPGTLDNSCACLQLADFAYRASSATLPLLFVFTDAEEVPALGEASSQGSFALARSLSSTGLQAEGLRALVFDMTGRGDRLLLSTAPGELLERNGLSLSSVASGYRELAALAERAASRAGIVSPLAITLPWSDDLGLTLGGIPSLTVSLLPEEEASALSSGKRPRTWDYMHSPSDLPSLAWELSFALMGRFLDALAILFLP
jgi:Zn-dependent M28 family amino/carboxypeptidase